MKAKDYNKTSDIYLAATLMCCGYSLISLEKTETKRVVFVFTQDDGLETSIQSYWASQIQVEPKAFADSLRQIKTRLYAS